MAPAFWLRQSSTRPPRHSRPRRNRDLEDAQDVVVVDGPNHPLNVDEKTPLLGSTKAGSSSTNVGYGGIAPSPPAGSDSDAPITSRTYWRDRLRDALLALLFFSLFTSLYSLFAPTCSGGIPRPGPFHPPYNPTPPPIDPAYYSRTFDFGLNVDNNHFGHTVDITEQLDSAHFPGGIEGTVHIFTGERYQTHNLRVYVQVSSLSSPPIRRITASHTPTLLRETVELRSHSIPASPLVADESENARELEPPQGGDDKDGGKEHPTKVNVYIYTRPETLQFGNFWLRSNLLNITFSPPWTFFETYHLHLSSVRGNIHSAIPAMYLQYLTAHELTATTARGNITGIWSLGASLSFSAGGTTDVSVYPKRWSSGPGTAGNISVSSDEGVSLRMPFESDNLSLRNLTVELFSSKGDVNAQVIQGAYTNITAAEGNVKARLLPYWSYYTWRKDVSPPGLYTKSKGDTSVTVEKAVDDVSYGVKPLEMVVCEHVAEKGGVTVRYPAGGWKGIARVESENGKADINGVKDGMGGKVVREGEGVVKWAGEKGKSDVKVKAGGDAKFEFWR
ncbi:hypothetical protein ABW20_dc0100896 [Dactylellina cionopaga]|nr:hypothetical protein ABW20_dc0100896 [Dactylellina cionopaga]